MLARTKVNFAYPTYLFRKEEQDPIVDATLGRLKQHDISLAKAAAGSGVSATTLYNWASGKTRRPQFATVAAVLGVAGYELVAAPRARDADGKAHAPKMLRRFPTYRSLERAPK